MPFEKLTAEEIVAVQNVLGNRYAKLQFELWAARLFINGGYRSGISDNLFLNALVDILNKEKESAHLARVELEEYEKNIGI